VDDWEKFDAQYIGYCCLKLGTYVVRAGGGGNPVTLRFSHGGQVFTLLEEDLPIH